MSTTPVIREPGRSVSVSAALVSLIAVPTGADDGAGIVDRAALRASVGEDADIARDGAGIGDVHRPCPYSEAASHDSAGIDDPGAVTGNGGFAAGHGARIERDRKHRSR